MKYRIEETCHDTFGVTGRFKKTEFRYTPQISKDGKNWNYMFEGTYSSFEEADEDINIHKKTNNRVVKYHYR